MKLEKVNGEYRMVGEDGVIHIHETNRGVFKGKLLAWIRANNTDAENQKNICQGFQIALRQNIEMLSNLNRNSQEALSIYSEIKEEELQEKLELIQREEEREKAEWDIHDIEPDEDALKGIEFE